jgi:class 3 adenylate cyclase
VIESSTVRTATFLMTDIEGSTRLREEDRAVCSGRART